MTHREEIEERKAKTENNCINSRHSGIPLLRILVLLPVLLVFMVGIASDRHVMGRYANSRLWNIFTWFTIVSVTVLTIVMFVLQALGW